MGCGRIKILVQACQNCEFIACKKRKFSQYAEMHCTHINALCRRNGFDKKITSSKLYIMHKTMNCVMLALNWVNSIPLI